MIVGLDVHKKETVGFLVRTDLKSGEWIRAQTTKEGLMGLVPMLRGCRVLIEASTSGKAVARFLRNCQLKVDLLTADVLQSHIRRAKSDKLDARDLARIGMIGEYKTCYIPTADEEELRALVRHIRDVREKIAELKNQIKAVAQRNLVPEPRGNVENAHVQARWLRLGLPPMEQRAVNGKLALLNASVSEEESGMFTLCELVNESSNVRRLLEIRGIDTYTASAIVAHCGDFSRFPNPKKIAAYAGLVPRLKQSGERSQHGRITKAGPNMLRHVLIEAAHNVVRSPGRLKTKFTRLKQRRGTGRAIVAIARTLITAIWRMITTNTPYADLNDEARDAKAWRLTTIARLIATGETEAARRLLRTADTIRAHGAWRNGRSKIIPTGSIP